jgi:hypothetical protein
MPSPQRAHPVPTPFSDSSSLIETCSALGERVIAAMRRTGQNEDVASVASAIQQCRVSATAPLNLAVVGQMRSAKSTLVNALVGEDLTEVGVVETTATVNWLRFAETSRVGTFQVHWREEGGPEQPSEVFPLKRLKEWIGESDHARRTRYIEIFSGAPFLKRTQVIDTPGTRSAVEFHGEITNQLLAQRLEGETLYFGCAADCLLYVVNPVGHASDEKVLSDFATNSRLAGSSPYNSVAVVQKWEALNEDDPLDAAERMAARLAQQLRSQVSDVVPVSGALMRAAAGLPPEVWARLARFAHGSTPDTLVELRTCNETLFLQRALREGAPPNGERSAALRVQEQREILATAKLPFACLKFVIGLAARERCMDGKQLRNAVLHASGQDRLVRMLEQRFFVRARILRTFGLIAKIVKPALVAGGRATDGERILETRAGLLRDLLKQAPGLERLVPGSSAGLREVAEEVARQLEAWAVARRTLQVEPRELREVYDQFVADFDALRQLDERQDLFPADAVDEAKRLLGSRGCRLTDRLGGLSLREVEEKYFWWARVSENVSGLKRAVAARVADRLQCAVRLLRQPGA